jgi:hypothetical protein
MKRLLSLLFFVAFVGSLVAQERSVNLNGSTLVDVTTIKNIARNGGTSDRLIPTTRDTIDYYVILKNYEQKPLHFYCNFTFDTIAGLDTTVSVTVLQKKFASESYSTLIAAANTDTIDGEVQYVRTSLGTVGEYTETHSIASHDIAGTAFNITADTSTFKYYPADTLRVPATTFTEAIQTVTVTKTANTSLHYKYLCFRLIINGNDLIGTGIKVKRVELQFF